MIKTIFAILICIAVILVSCTSNTEHDITGLWKCRDDKSDRIRSLVAIYKYQDLYYGRMLATYDEEGNVNDTILEKIDRAPGVEGNPPYCGLDFIYNVKEKESTRDGNPRYKGKIMDPQKGKVYTVQLWLDGNDLIVRGELFIFGKNIRWLRASKQDLPRGFSMGQIKNFIPEVPEAK
jgi:uncharacterized protein (DUF2147 family)